MRPFPHEGLPADDPVMPGQPDLRPAAFLSDQAFFHMRTPP